MTDRLTLTRALESGGMESAAAECIATEIYEPPTGAIAAAASRCRAAC